MIWPIRIFAVISMLISGTATAGQVTVKDTTWNNRSCWLIRTPSNVYYFEKGNGISGFCRMFDSEGKDWIQSGTGTGAASNGIPGEWRGFPNAANSSFGHPCRPSGSTTVVKDEIYSGDMIILDSYNATMEFEYWIFPSHIAVKVLKAKENYSFLFETTPGGVNNGYFYDAAGTLHNTPNGNGLDISPEWLYWGSNSSNSEMFMGHTPDDNFDDENFVRPGDMDIYSFGRGAFSPWTRYLPVDDLSHVCVLGFLEKTLSHEEKKAVIECIMEHPFEAYDGNDPTAGRPAVNLIPARLPAQPAATAVFSVDGRLNGSLGHAASSGVFINRTINSASAAVIRLPAACR